MRSPVVAMLWENWRLTRLEAAQRCVQGIIFGGAVLAGVAAFRATGDDAARLALALLVMTCAPLALSVAKLNGGRMMDGYRPGYPFYFLYTRPIRTVVLVAAPMAYLVGWAVAVYVGAALVLRAAFGYPFLLWPLAAWVAAYHLAQWAVQWGTRNKTVQWIGSMAAGLGFTMLAVWRGQAWPARLDVPLGDYALLLAVGVASFGLTVAGVARQRRGEGRAIAPPTATPGGVWDSLAGLFRFPCPTSSPTWAQIWFELRSSGLPVLVIGLALALVIPLLLVVTTRLDVMLSGLFSEPATRIAAVVVAMFSLPAVLLLGGNAFRIRTRQGHRYASVFEATQAAGTARTAGLTVLVRAVCLHAALLGVVASIWASASLIPFDVLGDNDTFIAKSRSPVSGWMRAIEGGVAAMSAREMVALAFVAFIAVAVMVGSRAALAALRARYARRLKIAGSLLLLCGLVLVLRAKDGQGGDGLEVQLIEAFARAAPWMTAAALALATVYLFWRSFAERLLTLRPACGLVLVSAAFGAAWVTVLRAAGIQFSGLPAADVVWMLSPALLPLTVSVLAPWSLGRVRHT